MIVAQHIATTATLVRVNFAVPTPVSADKLFPPLPVLEILVLIPRPHETALNPFRPILFQASTLLCHTLRSPSRRRKARSTCSKYIVARMASREKASLPGVRSGFPDSHWNSRASTGTLTLATLAFYFHILLEVSRASVTKSGVRGVM